LLEKGDSGVAIASYREAARVDPGRMTAPNKLGWELLQKGEFDEAIAIFKNTVRLFPEFALAHNNLGWALLTGKGDVNGAVTCFQEAMRLDPRLEYPKGNIARAERMRSLLPRLDEITAGRAEPKTAAEACELAQLCAAAFRKQYCAATRLYATSFERDPALAEDLSAGNRYNAACCALLACSPKGADSPGEEKSRSALRRRALEWLRRDLVLRTRQATSQDEADRQLAKQVMLHWLSDADLSSVRPGLARIGMPATERAEWDALWADVRALLVEAQKPPPPRPVAPAPREIQ
jgi:tetratricopeptide (TPR) repeat protein